MTHPTQPRLLPEWQERSCVLMSWPHADTDWAYMLSSVRQCYINMIRAISKVARIIIVAPDISEVAHELRYLVDMSRIVLAEMPTNDTWARDFGMICTWDSGQWLINDYKFNGWGLKFAACHDNLITRRLLDAGIVGKDAVYVNRLSFVLEGGSIDIDENGVLLTTSECLLSPNRNGSLSKDDITHALSDDLGCSKVIWLEHGSLAGDDTDSHVDTLARFLPGGIIAYSSCDRADDVHYGELTKMEDELYRATDIKGIPYRLLSLPIPMPIYDADGLRLPATYANFLIINGTVFLPVYGDDKYDRIAEEKIRAALPLYNVVTVDCLPLLQQHGSLHCATMQIPDILLG